LVTGSVPVGMGACDRGVGLVNPQRPRRPQQGSRPGLAGASAPWRVTVGPERSLGLR